MCVCVCVCVCVCCFLCLFSVVVFCFWGVYAAAHLFLALCAIFDIYDRTSSSHWYCFTSVHQNQFYHDLCSIFQIKSGVMQHPITSDWFRVSWFLYLGSHKFSGAKFGSQYLNKTCIDYLNISVRIKPLQ